LEPRLNEARAGTREVYFVDAAHFVWGAFVGCLWCICRLFMPTPSGRNRYNVLGAIHAVTHHLITLCNETYINANVICELLLEIRKTHIGEIPVTLVMDNAKYQRCSVVMELAEKLKIELLFLPAYSPNLNLIERLWKWVKKDCLYCRYYASFSNFKKAIEATLQKVILKERKVELDRLLTPKFQSFNNAIYTRA
jgi:transposase